MNGDQLPKMTDRELDRWIDAALATGSSDPRPGLELRILARLESEAAGRVPVPRRFWTWGVAFTCMAVAIAGIVVTHQQSRGPEVAAVAPSPDSGRHLSTAPPVHEGAPDTSVPRLSLRAASGKIRSAALPPTSTKPAPLTEQERLLLAWARISVSRKTGSPLKTNLGDDLNVPPIQVGALAVQPLNGTE